MIIAKMPYISISTNPLKIRIKLLESMGINNLKIWFIKKCLIFSLRFMLIFTLFLVHQFEAKDIPVLNSAQIKSALNKKTKLSVWLLSNVYRLYSYSCLCLLAQ